MGLIVFGMVLPWVVIVLAGWLAYRLVVQNGMILRQLEELEEMIENLVPPASAQTPKGLEPGTSAPAFELPELHGGRLSLEQFRGRRVLLVFFSADCPFCEQMASELATLPLDGRDRLPVPLVISSASTEEMREFVARHGLKCSVLLEQDGEVGKAYKTLFTPSGYLLDEEGTIVSGLVVGSPPLLELARSPDAVLAKRAAERGAAFLGMPSAPEA